MRTTNGSNEEQYTDSNCLHSTRQASITPKDLPHSTAAQSASYQVRQAQRNQTALPNVMFQAPHRDLAKKHRHFGLSEGKTFFPSAEEFADPYAYFEQIKDEGEQYGIVKIVPPEGWKPTFSLDAEEFLFKTRTQRVNLMEGQTRIRTNYIEQLTRFHSMFSKSLFKLPHLDKAPIDLYSLAKAVRNRLGYIEVTKNKQWAQVAREIKPGGYSNKCTGASKAIKECYMQYILPFEEYTFWERERRHLAYAKLMNVNVDKKIAPNIEQQSRCIKIEDPASQSIASSSQYQNTNTEWMEIDPQPTLPTFTGTFNICVDLSTNSNFSIDPSITPKLCNDSSTNSNLPFDPSRISNFHQNFNISNSDKLNRTNQVLSDPQSVNNPLETPVYLTRSVRKAHPGLVVLDYPVESNSMENINGSPSNLRGIETSSAIQCYNSPSKMQSGNLSTSTIYDLQISSTTPQIAPSSNLLHPNISHANMASFSIARNVNMASQSHSQNKESDLGPVISQKSQDTKIKFSISRYPNMGNIKFAFKDQDSIVYNTSNVSSSRIQSFNVASSRMRSVNGPSSKMHIPKFTHNFQNQPRENPESINCGICEERIHPNEKKLLCKADCNKEYHWVCLKFGKEIAQSTQFTCPSCLLAIGNDYGFGEGSEYTLTEFLQKANSFKQLYLKKHPPKPGVSLEDHMEAEFWRLANSMDENLEVEYGADINSTQYGSGFPDPETEPEDPYSISPWNLRNLPRLYDSLLHVIQPDIPGMMLPWVYVGMAFSAFCWHVEDQYTYSINYMHCGETKTWYGIPASNANKFEEAARSLLPEFFENQPDLLHQLTTIISPGKLVAEGVKVVAIDQRPNQFVVTYPRGYHAGFNQGFNINEAVNFALPDWIPYGRDSVMSYKRIGRLPVFSHERLLIDHGLRNHNNPRVVAWLREPVQEICNYEIAMRQKILKQINQREPIYETIDRDEDHITCKACNAYCALSQVASRCKPEVVCLEHAENAATICKCGKGCQYLRVRFVDGHLRSLVSALQRTQEATTEWVGKFLNFWENTRFPTLEQIQWWWREAEGKKMPVDTFQLGTFVDQCQSWTEKAFSICQQIDAHMYPKCSEYRSASLDINAFLGRWMERVEDCLDEEDQGRHCACRSREEESWMVQCDICRAWYHGECIGEGPWSVGKDEEWYCEMCQAISGGLEMRSVVGGVLELGKEAKQLLFTPYLSHEFAQIASAIQSGFLVGKDLPSLRRAFGMGLVWAIPKALPIEKASPTLGKGVEGRSWA
ncbi:hypothetical protein G9A89_008886 [Geosiphon pyriformis]|nr:hypothetical protein G9A89_008886 [Geosiphon pyriformis]